MSKGVVRRISMWGKFDLGTLGANYGKAGSGIVYDDKSGVACNRLKIIAKNSV